MSQKRAGPDASTADFTAIVNQHWDAVYRLLHSLTGNVHDTEDLTQETFLRALDKIAGFKPGTNMRSWLMRIGSNAFFDQQRKRKRARQKPLEHDLAREEPSPEHAMEVAQQSALLQAAMKELSALTRLVFHLRATEDLSFREIAAIAETTEQAARWHMHHARTKLLERLGDEF